MSNSKVKKNIYKYLLTTCDVNPYVVSCEHFQLHLVCPGVKTLEQ